MKHYIFTLCLFIIFFTAHAQDEILTPTLDSLRSNRKVLSTDIFQDSVKLRPKLVAALYKDAPSIHRQYRLGRLLRPVGPLISVSGIALSYVALKGKPASANINYNNVDITADYIIRSRPKLIGGLGLFVGGFVLLEFSNELISNSVKRFNLRQKGQNASALRAPVHFGLTPTGDFALFVPF